MKKRTLYELIGFVVLAIVMLGKFAADMPTGEPQAVAETTAAMMQAQNALSAPEASDAQSTTETTAAFTVTDSEGEDGAEDVKETQAETALAVPTGSAGADAAVETEAAKADTIPEDGAYTDKDSVALYIAVYGHLPSNFITKKKAEEAGWDSKAGNLDEVCPGMSIGGSRFGNYEGQLPDKQDRKYFECDINYNPKKGRRGAERIVYSNDGLVYYTGDHYNTFELLYGEP